MTFEIIDFDACDPLLDWVALTDALAAGHTQIGRAHV